MEAVAGRLRIAILHNSSPGGARRLVDEIAVQLSKTDRVTIVTWGDEPVPTPPGVEGFWCPGPPIHLPPPLHPFGDLARSFIGSSRAARTVDKDAFDVALVLACQWAQAPEALRRLRTPHLYFAQEGRRRTLEPGYRPSVRSRGRWEWLWRLGRHVYDALGSLLDNRAVAGAQVVATNSHFSAQQLAAGYGISPKVIELGVDVTRFHPKKGLPKVPVALLVGALDPTKGADLAVESLARVPNEYRPALRLIWNRGDTDYGDRLRRRGGSLGVEIQLLQNISDDQLVLEYQRASLLLALAKNEPFGLTVLEASACGTPTVAVAEGGFRRTVNPAINGVLVARNPSAIASAVTEIVRGGIDFDEEAMAKWTQEHWSWERCARDLRQELLLIRRSK